MSWPSASSGGLRRVCQSAKQAQNSQANGLDYFWTFLAAICLGGSHELVLPSWVKVLWQPAREEEANRIKKITLFLRSWISCETALSSQPVTGTSSEILGYFPAPISVGAGCCFQMTPSKTTSSVWLRSWLVLPVTTWVWVYFTCTHIHMCICCYNNHPGLLKNVGLSFPGCKTPKFCGNPGGKQLPSVFFFFPSLKKALNEVC